MTTLALLGMTLLSATVLPVTVTGPWAVETGAATVTVGGTTLDVTGPAAFEIAPPKRETMRGEAYAGIPVFNPKAGGWVKGARLKPLIAEECTATGALVPDSLRLRPAPDADTVFTPGVDYDLDPFWGTFGRLEGGAIREGQTVYADYAYELSRLDSIAADATGALRLVPGAPAPALALPPALNPGETAVVNVFVPAGCAALTDENLYPVDFAPPSAPAAPTAETLLPRTLAKLRNGEPLTVVAFGDSVTNGGGVGDRTELWYQNVFVARLKERFPKAQITLHNAAWPGGHSRGYLEAPAGGTYDFQRDVLDRKPDLVTIEFVNDAYLDEEAVQAHYAGLLARLHGAGAEVILITPHLVRPDWLETDTLKVAEDPRPYVRGLRRFAAENHVALADASRLWCRLHAQGLPYITLLANAINHPDARGQALFADALMALFPGG
ncbi:MAG: SGNH/GDSL hydrolase family protein [Candidatus Hydrogenedentes bacterium]|nr:SGNH/GDSL hydrolase family protein [Candidatus Hydrogenedentota bacterium]